MAEIFTFWWTEMNYLNWIQSACPVGREDWEGLVVWRWHVKCKEDADWLN